MTLKLTNIQNGLAVYVVASKVTSIAEMPEGCSVCVGGDCVVVDESAEEVAKKLDEITQAARLRELYDKCLGKLEAQIKEQKKWVPVEVES